jgi:hypothetical protein
MPEIPKDFLDFCHSVTAKRPKTVIDHILAHGFITTEELKDQYGYNHPPRAVRDAREHGVPIETFRVTGSDGRKIAAYRFGDVKNKLWSGPVKRTSLSKINGLDEVDALAPRCQPSPSQENERPRSKLRGIKREVVRSKLRGIRPVEIKSDISKRLD